MRGRSCESWGWWKKGRQARCEAWFFRAGALSQDQDKGDSLDGFTQHMHTLWKSNKEKPYLRVIHGKEKRGKIDLSPIWKVYFKRISLPHTSILWAQDKRGQAVQWGTSPKSPCGRDPRGGGALKKKRRKSSRGSVAGTKLCPKTSKVLSYSTLPLGCPMRRKSILFPKWMNFI